MREAGVDLVTVGVFSWALLEPQHGRYEFDWLDRRAWTCCTSDGIAVDLATATASPPPWLTAAHPEMLPAHGRRHRLWPGGRQAWCPSSPVFRERALALVPSAGGAVRRPPRAGAVARVQRARRPQRALLLRRLGRGVPRLAARPLRRRRRGSTTRGAPRSGASATATLEEMLPPRTAPTFANPTQQLDFARFSSDALLELLPGRARPAAPAQPRHPGHHELHGHVEDSARWTTCAGRPSSTWSRKTTTSTAADPDGHIELSFCADLTRGLAARPSVVADGALDQRRQLAAAQRRQDPRPDAAQQPRARRPRRRRRAASSSGGPPAPAPRSSTPRWCRTPAPTPRSGARWSSSARRWRRSARSPARRCAPTSRSSSTGTRGGPASWTPTRPRTWTYLDRHHALYRPLWDAGVTVDMVGPEADLSGYRLVLVPTLYLTTDAGAAQHPLVRRVGRHGPGHLLERHRRRERPRPARRLPRRVPRPARRARRGVLPAARGRAGATRGRGARRRRCRRLDRAARDPRRGGGVVVRDGVLTGVPAVTGQPGRAGTAWYLATRLDAGGDRDARAAPVRAGGGRALSGHSPGWRRCGATVPSRRTCSSSTTPTVRSRSRPPAATWCRDRPVRGRSRSDPAGVAVVREEGV